jgi:hypothetical protein
VPHELVVVFRILDLPADLGLYFALKLVFVYGKRKGFAHQRVAQVIFAPH